jgi:membrane protein
MMQATATDPQAAPEPAPADDDRGRHADSPWAMPLAGWKEVLIRTAKESGKDNVGLVAAGVAFYAFIALVPLLAATVLTYGFVASPASVMQNMQSLTSIMPADIAKLLGDQLLGVVQSSGGKKGFGILLALGVALFGARNAAGSVITALNIAYEEDEKRGFIKVTLLALAMTVGAVLAALVAVGALTLLHFLQTLIPDAPKPVLLLTKIASYLLLAIGAAALAATVYRYAPSREKAKWTWLTPGTAFAGIGWLLMTAAFGIYVSRFGSYNKTYGSLGAVVALLTWVYLSAYVFLFGAELNSELEHQTSRDTTEGGKKPLGERGAWSADHVADGTDDTDKAKEGGATEGPTGGNRAAAKAKGVGPEAEKPAALAPADAPGDHAYLTSRVSARAGRIAGGGKIGMLGSALATIGLSMLRKKGKAGTGAAILGTAAGLAWLRREKD